MAVTSRTIQATERKMERINDETLYKGGMIMATDRWIKVSMGIFEDEKILLIDNRDDKDSIEIIWFKMLTFAGKQAKKRAMKKEEPKKPVPAQKNKDTSKDESEALFERVWALYPNKKGKADVSLTQKKKLLKEGFDRLSRCIERYSAENKDTDKKYWKHGSTFFNGGYVDYLDENYETNNKPVVQSQKTEDEEPAMDFWSDN